MSVSRKLVRFTTRTAIGGGIIYGSCSTGLWKDADETIANYEKLKKDFDGAYESAPRVARFIERQQKYVKGKTIDPVCESVSNFQKKWLDFDYSWMHSQDGLIKPAWNKAVDVTCNFVAHAPENVIIWSVKGWKYVSNFVTDTTTTTDNVASASSGKSDS